MLQRVLSKDYKTVFRDYGMIEIPQGTMVDYRSHKDPHIQYCPVGEFDWIDEKYPEQSLQMKANAVKHGILVPKEELMLALRLRFAYDDRGSCRDIFRDVYAGTRYCRMESSIKGKVQWLTVTDDWDEPDCPLRSDMLIQLTGKEGKVAITEQQVKAGDEYAIEKVLPFSWEKPATQEQKLLMDLIYNT